MLTDGVGYYGKILPKWLRLQAFPHGRKETERIFSVWFSSACKCGKSWTFPLQCHWPWKTNNPVVQPSYFFSLFCLSVEVYGADAFGIFPKSRTAGIQTCAVSCYSLSLVFLGEKKKKKGIKTPTTLNTRSGHVSHGSLANYQMCILLSGIFLAVNTCSCLLVLKWYVIMNFPKEMGMSFP